MAKKNNLNRQNMPVQNSDALARLLLNQWVRLYEGAKSKLRLGGQPMFGKEKKEATAIMQDDVMTFLGKGTHFKGTLHFEGTMRIDGEVEGEIITQGTLIIGERGIINAEVSAGTVIIGGRINGNIHATQRVQLLTKSMVTGAVNTPSVTIEDGALLNGICEMKRSLEGSFVAEKRLLG